MKKEIVVRLYEQLDGTYKLPTDSFSFERTDLGYTLGAKLIIDMPDEKLRLSREQVRKAYNSAYGNRLEQMSPNLRRLLEHLGFSK